MAVPLVRDFADRTIGINDEAILVGMQFTAANVMKRGYAFEVAENLRFWQGPAVQEIVVNSLVTTAYDPPFGWQCEHEHLHLRKVVKDSAHLAADRTRARNALFAKAG